MQIGDSLLKAEANNFTALRFVLASAVIYTHSYKAIYGGQLDRDDLTYILGAPISTFSVDGFFFLSGFLVYPSLQRLASARWFLLARFTRLWPALGASVLLTTLGGWFVSSVYGGAYFGGATARFIAGNLSFLKGYYTLSGVNCGVEPCNVNESLWTLPFEARCYLGLALLGVVGLARPRPMAWLVLPLSILAVLAWDVPAVRAGATSLVGAGPAFVLGVFQRLWPLFALGALAYIVRRWLVLSWWVLILLLVLDLVAAKYAVGMQIRALFVGYAVLCLGLLSARRRSFSGAWPDYSYGMYIYAAPVMLIIHLVLAPTSHWALSALTMLFTLPIAMASWHGLEKPALDAFRAWKLRRQSAEVAAPAGE